MTSSASRQFIDDHCANCLEPLPDAEERLFCSELCSQIADTVRYWRRVERDGRIREPDVLLAVRTRVAHILGGGYQRRTRSLPRATRDYVWSRDAGRCVECGEPGEEIDHLDGDSPEPVNLQLLCKACHHAKTAQRMVKAPPEKQQWVLELRLSRLMPAEPILLADDEIRWQHEWRALKNARQQRLLDRLEATGLDPSDLRTREEMIDALYEDRVIDAGVAAGDDYDGGYGPDSYFARATDKDD